MALRSNLFDVDIAALERLLADANERLVARRDELVAAMDRVPPSFESHDDIERARIFATRLGKLLTECDRQRKADKASFVKAGKSVDRFFAAISTPADDALKDLEQRMERTAHRISPPRRMPRRPALSHRRTLPSSFRQARQPRRHKSPMRCSSGRSRQSTAPRSTWKPSATYLRIASWIL